MRFTFKNIVAFVVVSATLSFISYLFLQQVYKDSIKIDCYIKSFKKSDLQFFYNDKAPSFDIENSSKVLLISSQFLKDASFLIPDMQSTKYLRFDLGDDANTFIIDRMELIIKGVGRNDTIKKWKGREIEEIIGSLHDVTNEAENVTFMQLKGGSQDPYIILNDRIYKTLQQYYTTHRSGNYGLIFSALVIGLFVTFTLFFLLPYFKLPSIGNFFRQGYALVAGATLIVFLIFLNNQFHCVPDIKNKEKRNLAFRPKLGFDTFFEYPDLYNDYAKDNFSFRNVLYFLHSLFRVGIFHDSPLKDVIVGKHGWFFNSEEGCINDVRNIAQVPDNELAIMTINMLQRKLWLQKHGIKLYILVPPNKSRVYSEMLPNGYDKKVGLGVNRLDLYKQHLKLFAGIDIIDPTDSLIAAKKRHEDYYTTDTHWNLYGGYKGYQVLMQEIVKDFPQLQPIQESDLKIDTFYSNEGDLAGMIGLHDIYGRKEFSLSLKDTSKHIIMPDRSDIRISYRNNKTIDGSQLKLLMFRDSYSNYLIPFLNLHFKDADYIWSYEFMDKIIEQEKPDVVIIETLQRFLALSFLTPNPDDLK